jgi:heparosan-N-sulfate-glucuronate 5-epimerase
MPLKDVALLAKDLWFYLSGGADIAESDTVRDDWLHPPDWSYQLERDEAYFSPRDEAGIPLRRYPGPLGDQYLFSQIACYALAHWNRFRLTGAADSRDTFLRVTRWLAAFEDGRFGHHFPVAGMAVPWISCISQGEAASALSRAYLLTGDRLFLQQAGKAIGWLRRPVEDGGLLSRLPDGRPFLEEYPGTVYRHVLNGCLYAMVGLYDTLRLHPEDQALADLFAALVDAVGTNIEAWNIDGWSTYDYPVEADAPRNLNTMTYQILQSALLRYLGRVGGDRRLTEMAALWEQSAAKPTHRLKALRRKLGYRLASGW